DGPGTSGLQIFEPTSGLTAGATLDVTAAALVSIAVTRPLATLPRATTEPLGAIGTFTDGTTQDVTTNVTWESSNPNVTVSTASGSAGLATANALGTATITATHAPTGVNATTTVTATAATL